MADRVKIGEYLDAEEALRRARETADFVNEQYRIFGETRGKMGQDPDLPYNQRNEKLVFDEYDAAVRRHNAARASLGDALYGPEVSAERSRRTKAMDIPDEIFDELGPERDPIPSRRPAGSEAAYRYGERLTDLEREYMRARDTLREAADRVRSQPSSRETRQVHEAARRRFHSLSQQISPAGESRIRELIPDELFDDGLGPEYDPRPSRRPPGSEAAYRYGPTDERGFMRGTAPSARSTAARGLSKAAKVVGPVGLGIDALAAYGRGARDFDDWMSQEEEFLTGLPGLVSPSELPPPAFLPPDRLKAVEATQGMAGVAPDTKSPNVTEQEVRAYISNKVAKGDKLPAWAEKITSMKGGRLSINPVNPRTKARQEAAKRPRTWGNVLD